jgi:hypothetical protein
MNNQQRCISSLIFFVLFSMILNSQINAQPSNKTRAPLLGWNSYNCYGSNADANPIEKYGRDIVLSNSTGDDIYSEYHLPVMMWFLSITS